MPVIPGFDSEEDVRVGGIDVYGTAEQFGAGKGRALQGLGAAIGNVGDAITSFQAAAKAKKAQDNKLTLAETEANATIQTHQEATDIQINTPVDGVGVTKQTTESYDRITQEKAATIKDDDTRKAFLTSRARDKAAYVDKAYEFEVTQGTANDVTRTNDAMTGLQNTVRADGNSYDSVIEKGYALIDAQIKTPREKETMKRVWKQNTAYSRFQGLQDAAKSTDDFDILRNELTAPGSKWKDEFSEDGYTKTLDQIDGNKKAFGTLASDRATAAMDGFGEMLKDGTIPRPGEWAAADTLVKTSNNPTIEAKWARLNDQKLLLQDHGNETAAELNKTSLRLKTQHNARMPNEVNVDIDETVPIFGGSPTLLGLQAWHEYHGNLPGMRVRAGDPKFGPQAVGNAHFEGVKPEAMNAATLAGEILGRPLVVISAHRSNTYQQMLRHAGGQDPNRRSIASYSRHTEGDAFDFSTEGMSGAEKAKMVDALLQAGFTGFGEYAATKDKPGHIHADMRELTPNTVDLKTGWSGWSKMSPEVAKVMEARGYGPGMKGSDLSRGNAGKVLASTPVDYTLQAKSPKGAKPSDDRATGLMQFKKPLWLELITDPAIIKRLPADMQKEVAGKGEAELLELRKSHRWSVMMAGAGNEKAGIALEGVLHRPATDGEIYMSHFLGRSGEISFVSAVENTPNESAAKLFPEAAKANPPIFFDNDGKPLSMKEVYDRNEIKFSASPTVREYQQGEFINDLATKREVQETKDPITSYSNSTNLPPPDLNAEGGYAARGVYAAGAASRLNLPNEEMKPYMEDELAAEKKRYTEGDVDEKIAILKDIQQMDLAAPGMGKAAYEQLGMKDTVFEHAAQLADDGNYEVAHTVISGQDRLNKDKTLEKTIFGQTNEAISLFNQTTEGALSRIPPEARNAIFDAAKAHYAEVRAGHFDWDPTTFEKSVAAVTGEIGDVNDHPTVLPKGMSADEFDHALDALKPEDYAGKIFSKTAMPPIDVSGNQISPDDIADEGEFVWTGGNEYIIRLSDGKFMTTGERNPNGQLQWYVFVANQERLKEIANRPVSSDNTRSTAGTRSGVVDTTTDDDYVMTGMSGGGGVVAYGGGEPKTPDPRAGTRSGVK